MKETELIEWLAKQVRSRSKDLKMGIGDDCTVISAGKKEILITCDALIEGVHFKKGWAGWKELGKKGAGAALSDIAAMGGNPKFGWTHLSIPKKMKEREIKEFFFGLLGVFKKFGVGLAGGNINFSPGGFQAVTTIWGERPAGIKMLRSSAKPGDGVYIGGPVGWAGRGRKLLSQKSPSPFPSLRLRRIRVRGKYIHAFLNPQPQIPLGLWLAKNKIANACIDVSDGLLVDLNHIAKASGVKIVLDKISKDYTGGEDYVLALTAPPAKEKWLARKKGVKKIGVVQKGKPGIKVGHSSHV